MIRLIQRRLIVPRGDTGTFSIPVLAGKNTGDASVFTIFDPLTHRKICEKVMQLSDGVLSMQFTHGDTVNLPVGQYVWDIKFYSDPVIADGHIVGGEEVDSYYAAFTLPVCEIRETGDNLLMDDRTPNAMLAPDQIDLITASLTEIAQARAAAASSAAEADTSATNAETSASAAAVSAQAALDSQVAALASQQAAQAAATDAANSAATATQKAAQIEADLTNKADKSEIPTLVSQLENDSGYLTQETDPTVPAWAKAQTKPTYTAQEVGALPADTYIPNKVSDLQNDAGYLTQHQDISGKANSADLAAVATSGSYNDLSDKPTIPDIQIDGTSIIDNGIANIPIASSGVPGVVGIDSLGGITVGFNNNLEIHPASNADIKSGNQYLQPIVPSRQDRAVFYGLATAAGADESASQEAFGTYREPAKAAIRTMIGAGTPLDVQVNGTSVVNNGIATIPIATDNAYGLVRARTWSNRANAPGIYISDNGDIGLIPGNEAQVKALATNGCAITPGNTHQAVFWGLAKAAGDTTQYASSNTVGTYTTEAKAAIHTMLGIDPAAIAAQVDIPLVETVSGTTPTITGQPNVRYVCGEVSTISITPPASGSVDVIFESGSTATTMTVPSTVKWPAWFDAETLEANTTYEVLITDGIYGSVMTWAT